VNRVLRPGRQIPRRPGAQVGVVSRCSPLAQDSPVRIRLAPGPGCAYGLRMVEEEVRPSEAEDVEIVSDSRCFVCGLANRHGLQVRFFKHGTDTARATCDPALTFMGYEGLLHGGVSAALLDEIMIKAVLASGRLVVTGRMSIQYRKPVSLGSRLHLRGQIVGRKGRLFHTQGSLFRESEKPLVTATGTYVEVTGPDRERLLQSPGRQPG